MVRKSETVMAMWREGMQSKRSKSEVERETAV